MDIFKRFLIRHNCYDKFLVAISDEYRLYIDRDFTYDDISDTFENYESINFSILFVWENTDDGYSFWEEINNDWRKFLNKIDC